jgi:hypothetical protein
MTCVGFVDMLGFTALTEELEPDELGATVTTFETRAYETVAEHGGRVIKTIGDEVMFTVEWHPPPGWRSPFESPSTSTVDPSHPRYAPASPKDRFWPKTATAPDGISAGRSLVASI